VGNFQGKRQCSLNVMTIVKDQFPPTASTGITAGIFESLEREWRRLSARPQMTAHSQRWAAAEPVLGGCGDAGAIIRLATWQGRQPSAETAEVLRALLRQSPDPLAARTLLQALLPRIRAERVLSPKYGHGVGEAWQQPVDTVADLVAECFVAVMRHAGEDHDDVARLVLQEATRKLRTARQAERRYRQRTVLLVQDHAGCGAHDLSAARSGAEWLATALLEAVRSRRLSKTEARLVYAARVKGLPASDVGRRAGMRPKAVYYALARAERALLSRAA
jgi:DNA-directed RNA polymerase specialized sigma24 family protein